MPGWPTLVTFAPSSPGPPARRAALELSLLIASAHRRRLKDTVFIGVTGSCGKTTTVSLVHGILQSSLPGRKPPGGGNNLRVVAGTVLRTGKADAFSVIEVAAWEPGSVARVAGVVKPNIAVVTNVGADHRQTFRTLDATATEKAALLSSVVDGGTAVLNADDQRVMAMAATFPGRTVTFGCSPGAMLRADDVRSAWPERLSFTLHYEGQSMDVLTRLCGKHWVSAALAALGVSVAMGASLEQAVRALARVEPAAGRMSPVERNGVVFVRDDGKAPLWTVDAALEFLADARSRRKTVVFGTLSDYSGSASSKYRAVARRALEIADEVVFVGRSAQYLAKVSELSGGRLRAFSSVEEAGQHVINTVRRGDLVVLKGSGVDNLGRVIPSESRTNP